jgi:Na+/H+ antiporter NhaD/arsenite permease-like protein
MASNIGGAATLIGDPPNVLIASAAGIEFIPFSANMAPPTLIILLAFIPIIVALFRKKLYVPRERQQMATRLVSAGLIRNPKLLAQCGIILLLVLIGFLLQGWHHLKPAIIALSGATLLLIWTRQDPTELLESVEWATLMFFVGLFITVEALVKVGIIDQLAMALLDLTQGSKGATTIFLLWFSAIASGIVDNIPYTATMIPLVESMGETIPIEPLWWSLALGADLGGNLTLVGASANIIVASLAERSGHKLPFGLFLRYGFITVLVSLGISSLWLLLRYL